MFRKPQPEPLKPWQKLDTKYQWPVGHKEHVVVWDEQTGKHIDGYIYSIDLYSIVLYDQDDYRIGVFPKEWITEILAT